MSYRCCVETLYKHVVACLFFCSLPALFSCGKQSDAATALTGHWLILYPDHKLTSQHQRDVYGRYQDSLLRLYGLKLITLGADGSFQEADSLLKPPGKWLLWGDSLVKIREAGKGFNPFNTTYSGVQEGEALLTQSLLLENERIKLVWHLKKVENGENAASLFSDSLNAWRKIPPAPETGDAMRKRLAAMLHYYAVYFRLVGTEARYFAPGRVPLPLIYYQHAVSVKAVMPDAFEHLFYDDLEAAEAFVLLKQAVEEEKNNFPRDKNFVLEYGLFFEKLAHRFIEKNAAH